MEPTVASSLPCPAAAAFAHGQHYPTGTLYVVATPIGNLADLTLRAIHVLGLVNAVACEDTRVTGQLLQRLGLHRPLLSVHEHNEAGAAQLVIERLQRGERLAYVSDAGTPAISDPGAVLVAAVQAAGLRVMPLPGASSVVTALSAAGDVQAEGFRFAGFLPPRELARRQRLQALASVRDSVVLFEAPHRIEALADELAAQLGGRRLTVCRELSKQFEQIHTLSADALPAWLAASADHRRGEFVLVLHALPAAATPDAEAEGAAVPLDRLLGLLMAELALKQAVALAAQISGVPRNAVYARALALRDAAEAAADAQADEADAVDAPDAGTPGYTSRAARRPTPVAPAWPDPRPPRRRGR